MSINLSLDSSSMKGMRRAENSREPKNLISQMDETRVSTDTSDSNEQSGSLTPTRQFAPSVKKLRFYRNATF